MKKVSIQKRQIISINIVKVIYDVIISLNHLTPHTGVKTLHTARDYKCSQNVWCPHTSAACAMPTSALMSRWPIVYLARPNWPFVCVWLLNNVIFCNRHLTQLMLRLLRILDDNERQCHSLTNPVWHHHQVQGHYSITQNKHVKQKNDFSIPLRTPPPPNHAAPSSQPPTFNVTIKKLLAHLYDPRWHNAANAAAAAKAARFVPTSD